VPMTTTNTADSCVPKESAPESPAAVNRTDPV
jgi:hypothetical protein